MRFLWILLQFCDRSVNVIEIRLKIIIYSILKYDSQTEPHPRFYVDDKKGQNFRIPKLSTPYLITNIDVAEEDNLPGWNYLYIILYYTNIFISIKIKKI